MRTRCTATITDLRLAIDSLPRKTRVAMLEGVRANEIIVGSYAGDEGICPMLAAHREGARTRFSSFADAWDGFAFRGTRHHKSRRASERELLILTTHLEASLLEEEDGAEVDLSAAMAEHRNLVEQRYLVTAMAEHNALREDRERREQGELVAERERQEQREIEEQRDFIEQRELAKLRELSAQRELRARSAQTTARATPPRAQTRRLREQPGSPRVRPGEPDRSSELRDQPGWAWMRPFRRYDEYEQALALVRSAHDALGEEQERERELVG